MVLPSSMRLKGYRCFDHLYRNGIRYYAPSMLLRVVKAEPKLEKIKINQFKLKSCKCAIAISSKVNKKAVIRNRLRRLIHNHLTIRLIKSEEHANKWLLLSLKPQSSSREDKLLLKDCDRLLFKAGLIQ